MNLTRRTFNLLASGVGAGLMLRPLHGLAAASWDLKATSGETVYFRGWQYKTDVVQSNVDRYNQQMSGKVDYATVTGDYPAIMEQNLIASADLDVLYANPATAVRYFEGKWVLPAVELQGQAAGVVLFRQHPRRDACQPPEVQRARPCRQRLPEELG